MNRRSLGFFVGLPLAVLLGLAACTRKDPPVERAPAVPPPPPSQASSPEVAAALVDAATQKPFGAPCVTDVECGVGVCFHKRIKGPDAGHERRGADEAVAREGYCSIRCEQDLDCPVPPTRGKCGARGMCKRPE